MITEEPVFETPLPGVEVPPDVARVLVDRFYKTFRKANIPEVPVNLPTACTLSGRKDREYLASKEFLQHESVLFYLEGAEHLRRTTPRDIVLYLSNREPWEDYDICLFDEGLAWCIGITHNDEIIVVDRSSSDAQGT